MENQESLKPGSPDWILIGAVAALLSLGLMTVYSSTAPMGVRFQGDSGYFLKRQVLWLGVGMAALILFTWLPYRFWSRISVPLVLFAIAMLVTGVVTGSGRLLVGASVSPVEFAKLAIVVFASHWFAAEGEPRRSLVRGISSLFATGIVVALVMAQPDISEAMIMVLVVAAMYLVAGGSPVRFLALAVTGVALLLILVMSMPTALTRLQPFLDSWKDPLSSTNFQLRQGIIGLGSGGLFGLGAGGSRMAHQWLPAAHADSILAIVGEEQGFLGSLVLIGLFAVLIYRGLHIASKATDAFGGLLAAGSTFLIAFQALLNIAVVTGTIPFTGISLPFISLGGSSLVVTLCAVGILLSVSRSAGTGRTAQRLMEQYWMLITNRDLSSGRDVWVEFWQKLQARMAGVLTRDWRRPHRHP